MLVARKCGSQRRILTAISEDSVSSSALENGPKLSRERAGLGNRGEGLSNASNSRSYKSSAERRVDGRVIVAGIL